VSLSVCLSLSVDHSLFFSVCGRGIFLKRGDVVTATIEEIGSLQNPVY